MFSLYSKNETKLVVGRLLLFVFLSFSIYKIAGDLLGPERFVPQYDEIISSATEPVSNLYSFINISNEVYKMMGRPSFTPPEVVVSLIDLAAKGNPELIVLDINLYDAVANSSTIIDYFRNYSLAPILVIDPIISKKSNGMPEHLLTKLDEVIGRNDNIYWASPAYNYDQDFIVRKVPFFKIHCHQDIAIPRPSVSIASALLRKLGNENYSLLLNSLRVSNDYNPCEIEKTDDNAVEFIDPITKEEIQVESERSYLNVKFNVSNAISSGDESGYNYSEYESLIGYLENKDNDIPVDHSDFENRTVLIGGTYTSARDELNTPIGKISGAMFLVDAIETAYRIDNLYPLMNVKNDIMLLLLAFVFGVISIVFRNTLILIFTSIVLCIFLFIFSGLYIVELYSVLSIVVLFELHDYLFELLKRYVSDYKTASQLEMPRFMKVLFWCLSSDMKNRLSAENADERDWL